jgi:hypothetical protein
VAQLTSLTSLRLSDNRDLDDEALAMLKPLAQLTSLSLCYLPLITDAGLCHLECLRLDTLKLIQANIQGTGLDALTSLRSLDVGWCSRITDGLRLPPCLEHLSLNACRKVYVRELPDTLRTLNVRLCSLLPLEQLQLPRLEVLTLERSHRLSGEQLRVLFPKARIERIQD